MSENGEAAMSAEDIREALDTIKAIEVMGFFMDETQVKLKYAQGIFRCMDLLRKTHDDLVAALPPEVIAAERAKSFGANPPGAGKLNVETTPLGVA